MGWAQWVIATLLVLQVIGGFVLDGRPRSEYSATDILVGTIIMALLLYAGGFWR